MGARHAVMRVDVGEVGLARHDAAARAGGDGNAQSHNGNAARRDKHERPRPPRSSFHFDSALRISRKG